MGIASLMGRASVSALQCSADEDPSITRAAAWTHTCSLMRLRARYLPSHRLLLSRGLIASSIEPLEVRWARSHGVGPKAAYGVLTCGVCQCTAVER